MVVIMWWAVTTATNKRMRKRISTVGGVKCVGKGSTSEAKESVRLCANEGGVEGRESGWRESGWVRESG